MKNKKGQGMSTNTIILLILGLVVLVALIWGFATGWTSFKQIISPTNVDNVVEECNLACELNNKFSFCSGDRILRVNEDNLEVKTSCFVLANLPAFSKYNIETCSQIDCELSCEDITIDEEKVKQKKGNPELTEGKYDLSELVTEESCFIN